MWPHLPEALKYGYTPAASVMGSPHNWSFVGTGTRQQANPMPVPRGKVVGGSSAINGQVFLRGAPEDYDHWAALGNDAWSYVKVLPYFRKLETEQDIRDDFHGSDGPIPVRRHPPREWLPFQTAFHRACAAAGFPDDPDMNHPESLGVGPLPMNDLDGIRMSTALTYLNPIRHRLNLTIKANVLIRRIRFDGQRAIGVEVDSGGEPFLVEAEEIILSAGAIKSPQMLLLSGVGPGDHLRQFGIPVVHELPGVGQNLRDHPLVYVRFRAKADFPLDSQAPRLQTALHYTATDSDTRGDMQILPSSFSTPLGAGPSETDGVGLTCILNLAMSSGELTLTSTDPQVQPHLAYHYLEDPWDRQRLREAVRLCLQLVEHDAFRDIVAERLAPTDPDLASDAALDAWLLANLGTTLHMSGTCKMGPAADPLAVVDQDGRVHGLAGLRVADTSLMPNVVRRPTNATAIMIGERVVDFIRHGL